MRIRVLATSAALALALAACGGDGGNEVTTEASVNDAAADAALGANATADSNMAGSAMPTDAAGFANAVAASDLYEVESATLAAEKATSQEVKEAAGHIKTDHQKSTADLKTLASQNGMTVAPALDAEKQGMLDQLRAANGAEFDRLFLEQQKTAHQKTLSLLQGYSANGDNAALKDFATKGATIVKGHIDHLGSISLK